MKCPLCQSPIDASKELKVNIVIRDTIAKLYPIGSVTRRKSDTTTTTTVQDVLANMPSYHNFTLDALKDPRVLLTHTFKETMFEQAKALEGEEDEVSGGEKAKEGRVLQNSIRGIQNFDLQRLMRRGGVMFECELIYDELRKSMKNFMDIILRDAITTCAYRRAKIVVVADVLSSRSFGTAFGFGGGNGYVHHVWSEMFYHVLEQIHPDLDLDIEPKAFSMLNDINTYVLERTVAVALERRSRMQVFTTGTRQNPDFDGDDDDDRSFGVKAFPVFDPTEFDDPTEFNAFSVKFYSNESEDDDYDPLPEPVVCLTSRDIQVRSYFLFIARTYF